MTTTHLQLPFVLKQFDTSISTYLKAAFVALCITDYNRILSRVSVIALLSTAGDNYISDI